MTIDLSGQTFGSLSVVTRSGPAAESRWLCRCVCGKNVVCNTGNLRQKRGTRCGCERRAKAGARAKTHGLARSREYRIWAGIMTRCLNQNARSHARYGARGIIVAEEWRSFEAFLSDMGSAPSPSHSIERKNNDGPYSPENCVWATSEEQALNTSRNHILTYKGRSAPLLLWAEEVGLTQGTLHR